MQLRNPNLNKEIESELLWLDERYFQFDKPVPFQEGLTLYPILVSDYLEFTTVSSCLTLNKNESPEGLTQSHLGYLVSKMEDKETGGLWSHYFYRLLELVFHIKHGVKCLDCGEVMDYKEFWALVSQGEENLKCSHCQSQNFEETLRCRENPQTHKKELIVNGVAIDSKGYNRLRQIILYQNFPDYQDDSWVDPDVKRDQQRKQEILSKSGEAGSATLERKIVAIASQTSYKLDEILNLPMRKFIIMLQMVDDVIRYQCDRTGMMSGMVTFKQPLEHWLYKNKKSMYGTAVTADSYIQQISKANGN